MVGSMCSTEPGASAIPEFSMFVSESCSGNGRCVETSFVYNSTSLHNLPEAVCHCEPGWSGRSAWFPTDGRDCHIHLDTVYWLWVLNLINAVIWFLLSVPYIKMQYVRFKRTKVTYRLMYGKEYWFWTDRALSTAVWYVCVCFPCVIGLAVERTIFPEMRIGLDALHSILWFVGRTASYIASNTFQISVFALVLKGERSIDTEAQLSRHIYKSHIATGVSILSGLPVFAILFYPECNKAVTIDGAENGNFTLMVHTEEQVARAQQSWILFHVPMIFVTMFAIYRSCSVRYRVTSVINEIMGLNSAKQSNSRSGSGSGASDSDIKASRATSQPEDAMLEIEKRESSGELEEANLTWRSDDASEIHRSNPQYTSSTQLLANALGSVVATVDDGSESTSTHDSLGSSEGRPSAGMNDTYMATNRPVLLRRRNQLVRGQRMVQAMCMLEIIIHVLFAVIPYLWTKYDYILPITWIFIPITGFNSLRNSAVRPPPTKRSNGNILGLRRGTAKKGDLVVRAKNPKHQAGKRGKGTSHGTGQDVEKTVDSSDASWRTWVDMEADVITTIEDLHPGVLAIGGGLNGGRWILEGGVIEEGDEEEEDDVEFNMLGHLSPRMSL